MNILIKSATIIDPGNKALNLKKRDIHIKNGIIQKIAAKIAPTEKHETIELHNLHLSVGWFDTSVSFGEPGYEERETIENGLKTAAKSGFTDIVLNPSTYPVPDSSGDIIFLINAARGHATRLYPLGTLTVKSEGEHLAELFDMGNAGAVGFYDFKAPVKSSNLMKMALLYAQNFKGLVHSFPMDMPLAGKGMVNEGENATGLGLKGIPAVAETLQIARDLYILEYTGGKLHIPTISTAGAVQLISEGKQKKMDITCSVAIHNLWFTDKVLHDFESNYKVLPPLRSQQDRKALIKGVKDGIIDYVTSDHIPLTIEDKRVEFDNAAYGTIGLESAFGILNHLFDTETAIALLTKGRERYRLSRPQLQEGEPANITLFDPGLQYNLTEKNLSSTSRNSMFLGEELKGRAYGVLAHDRLVL